jgi:hypothetical protein
MWTTFIKFIFTLIFGTITQNVKNWIDWQHLADFYMDSHKYGWWFNEHFFTGIGMLFRTRILSYMRGREMCQGDTVTIIPSSVSMVTTFLIYGFSWCGQNFYQIQELMIYKNIWFIRIFEFWPLSKAKM